MILNTGSRTDIPAWYGEWFYNRVKEGYVLVKNPYDPTRVTRYRIAPDVVDCICFCTKNPAPMLERLEELDAFRQVWYVTITPYGREIEPRVPSWQQVAQSFARLSHKVGKRAVIWRYDPIFVSAGYSTEFHRRIFREMAEILSPYTESCVISFLDLYQKTRRNFPEGRQVSRADQMELAKSFSDTAKKFGLTLRSCCEGEWMSPYGIDVSGCMSRAVLERAIGEKLRISGKKPAREGCDCLLGDDIGAYNTCPNGCVYCYANCDKKTAEDNFRRHDPKSPLLAGSLRVQNAIRNAQQQSWIDGQMSLFDWADIMT